MAKIGVYYDGRRLDKSGKGMVCISVAAGGQTRYVATGIKVEPEAWNGEEVCNNVRMVRAMNNVIKAHKARIELAALQMEQQNRKVKAVDIVAAIKDSLEDIKTEAEPTEATLGGVYRKWMEMKSGKTAKSYASALRSLLGYCKELDRLPLRSVTKGWLMGWDAWMAENGVASVNARAVYMRNLRAVCNYAMDEGLTDNYPFRRYSIKTQATEKRSLSVEKLREIWNYEPQEYERRWVVVFKLMFCLMGINAVDLGRLTEIVDGRVVYNRSKTKKLYSIKVEPEAMELIEQIKGKKYLVDLMDTNKDHETWLHHANHALRHLGVPMGERLGRKVKSKPIAPGLTTYWARHTWATIAASLDIPKETIAKALGHGSNTVTDVYIDFERRKIDEANRRVLDWVLYGKR